MIMEFYVIRHKPTGGFLPELSGVRAGFTYTEPQTHGVPRLFESAVGAKRALTWWLKGITSVFKSRDWEGDYDETWSTTFEEHRKAEDMEIIPVRLHT